MKGLTKAELQQYQAWFESTYPDIKFIIHPAYIQQWRSSLLLTSTR